MSIENSSGSHQEQSPEDKARRHIHKLRVGLEILLKNQKQEESLMNRFMKYAPGGAEMRPDRNLQEKIRELLNRIGEPLPQNSAETEKLLKQIDSSEGQQKFLSSFSQENNNPS